MSLSYFERLNLNVAKSSVGKYFRLEGSKTRRKHVGSRFTTEMRAGLTTFVTMVTSISSFLILIFLL